jgi:addiction module RelE/StbE family toxin
MQLILSKRFQKDLTKLKLQRPQLTEKIKKTFKLLQKNVNHPSLRLHKLSGTDNWSISVGMDIRIILHREGDKLYLLRIGSHDEIY